jgi:hypothetical protein
MFVLTSPRNKHAESESAVKKKSAKRGMSDGVALTKLIAGKKNAVNVNCNAKRRRRLDDVRKLNVWPDKRLNSVKPSVAANKKPRNVASKKSASPVGPGRKLKSKNAGNAKLVLPNRQGSSSSWRRNRNVENALSRNAVLLSSVNEISIWKRSRSSANVERRIGGQLSSENMKFNKL